MEITIGNSIPRCAAAGSAAATILALLFLGCGNEPLPPGPLTGLTLEQGDSQIKLSWDPHPNARFDQVVVVRGDSGGFPSGPDDGQRIYDGSGTSLSDPCKDHGATTYYAAFAHDGLGSYSPGATASAKCAFWPFTLIVLPDTQHYSDWMYKTTVDWILAQQKERNIAAVLHEGDITHNNTGAEWKVAAAAFARLDNTLPYVLAVGNHDMTSTSSTALFNTHFPHSRMSKLLGFGGSYPPGKMDNSFYTFRAGGRDWLVVSVVWDPDSAALQWADQVVAARPTHRTIVLTHAFLTPAATVEPMARRIWDGLIRKHGNILFVFNGHYTAGDAARLKSKGDKGNPVYIMFANYQTEPASGYGMLRIVRFDTLAKTLSVKSYSTLSGKYREDDANQFTFTGVDL